MSTAINYRNKCDNTSPRRKNTKVAMFFRFFLRNENVRAWRQGEVRYISSISSTSDLAKTLALLIPDPDKKLLLVRWQKQL